MNPHDLPSSLVAHLSAPGGRLPGGQSGHGHGHGHRPWPSRRARKRSAAAHRIAQDIHRVYRELTSIAVAQAASASLASPAAPASAIPAPASRPLFDLAELTERIQALSGLSGDNQKALLKAFRQLLLQGPQCSVAQAPQPEALNGLLDEFPNFAEVTRWVQEQLTLCRLSPDAALKLPPILLDGPPGVGKTAYSQALARRLGVAFEQIDLSSARSSMTLLGLDSGYQSSHPGRIWQSLQHGCLSVTWLLDEIDKIPTEGADSGAQYLLGLLEPVSSTRFTDNWSGLPIDASWLVYIATSNDKTRIDEPLLSRFTVFDIAPPTPAQLRQIVGRIYEAYQQGEPWGAAFAPTLDDPVIEALAGCTPREIRRLLRSAMATAAARGRRQVLVGDLPVTSPPPQRPRIGFV